MQDRDVIIKQAGDGDWDSAVAVQQSAFGTNEEAELVVKLLDDPSAQPCLSLLAWQARQVVGHILFTRAQVESSSALPASLLAPLAVNPQVQRQGIGGRLIAQGLGLLEQQGVGPVFVLGYPDYYRRFGFEPAGPLGFQPPYPISAEQSDAWRVYVPASARSIACRGRVSCADALMDPKYWRE